LHRRYCKIALQYNCNSYWIDTACIPDDNELRTEAILEINNIFANSKITLVCDKDVMMIDVINPININRWETIFATLLVCDRNVRVWTLLESIKGSAHIYLLTKGNRTVCFKSGLNTLFKGGAVDLVALLSAATHLLPRAPGDPHLGFEEVGDLLSHRHASRPGDDVLIWGLLTVAQTISSIEVLFRWVGWTEDQFTDLRTGKFVPRRGGQGGVRTGFQVSSAMRSEKVGFRWAPKTSRVESLANQTLFYPYDGQGSAIGKVYGDTDGRTVYGGKFVALWLGYVIRKETYRRVLGLPEVRWHPAWKAIASLFVNAELKRVAFLKALSEDLETPYVAIDNRDGHNMQRGVICASYDDANWVWHEVCEEPMGDDDLGYLDGRLNDRGTSRKSWDAVGSEASTEGIDSKGWEKMVITTT